MHPLIQDLFFSLRSLRRSPGFTLMAVLALTLGIAGNTVVFSVINATLLRPLPYPGSSQLLIVSWQNQPDLSAPAFFMLKDRAHSFSSIAAFYSVDLGANLSTGRAPRYVKSLSVSKDFFQTLGILPEAGRPFSTEEDRPNAPRTVILSDGIWAQDFGRDRSALGRNLRINGENYRVIGIMPPQFRSYPDADIWLPLQLAPNSADQANNYTIVGRLADGVSRQQAQFEMGGVADEYHRIYPWSAPLGRITVQALQSFLMDSGRPGLATLFASVALVFLIACTNVAVLILVRGAASTQTIAVRAALGSSRGRLVQSLLGESVLLSIIAGVLGIILAKESFPLLRYLWPADLPLSTNVSIDGHVALFTLAVGILSPMLFGLTPALKLSRVNIGQLLARSLRTASASAEQGRMVRVLVLGQIALTVMLLAGTALLLKSLLNLYSVDLGFEPEHLAVAQVSLADERYRTTASTNRLLGQVVEELEALPGVDAVGAVEGLPLEHGLRVPIHPLEMPQAVDHADEYRPVSTGYFKALRISLRSGRLFLSTDKAGSAPVAILNETMARHWWPNSSPIGQFVQVDEEIGPQAADVPRQIVGVVADIHEKGPGLPPPPTIFIPIAQTPDNITAFYNTTFLTSIVVRALNGTDLSNQVRGAVQSGDPDLPVASFRPFSQVVNRSLANQRFVALLTSIFGAFALLLTAVGIQGLLNYLARLRAQEIAVRMVVGASRTQIVRMVVQQGTGMIFFALLVGWTGSLIIRSLLRSLLYDVQSASLILIFATGLLLGLVATLMSLVTAVRAASIEPMAVLRNE